MDRFLDRLAGKLSGGMKQKLALACALVAEPRVLLLDEPTTGVDPVSRREFWDALAQLSAAGMTIVVATPYLDEAERCHRVGLMYEGEVREVGTPKEIRIPDFVLLAEAMGCVGLRCETKADVDAVIEKAMAIDDAPVVVDFVVGHDAQVWPMIAAGTSNDEIMAARDVRPVFGEGQV